MSEKIVCPNCLTEHISEFNIESNNSNVFKGQCSSCKTALKFRLKKGLLDKDSISFSVNGIIRNVDNRYPLTMTLNEYLRDELSLTGTKVMCREGGCGACIANAEIYDYTTGETRSYSINTCLFPLYSCDNLKITTVEGIGSKSKGFNDIQTRLVKNNGTQCGFCTPGFVMNMYGLLLNDPKPTKEKIEANFDGNLCRCTGYRSILDAMKSFASDANPIDIEELNKLKCLNDPRNHSKSCHSLQANIKKKIHIIKDDDESQWFAPTTMNELYDLMKQYKPSSYKIVSGNTGVGVYKNVLHSSKNIYIDIKQISDMFKISINTGKNPLLTLGSQITLIKMIESFDSLAGSVSGFEYLSVISAHLKKIANVPVRNTGTWSGNLMMKRNHLDFSSDVFICFETVNASIKLLGPDSSTQPVVVTPLQLLTTPVDGKVIYSVDFKAFNKSTTLIQTYKIMPRSQNSHAYVNAGFNFSVASGTLIVQSCSIVFGGLSPDFVHATKTEEFLIKKSLDDQDALKQAFKILNDELVIDNDPVLAAVDYRRLLAVSLFYKFLLFANKDKLSPRLQSSLSSLIDSRAISSGLQDIQTDSDMFPVTEPMPKLNALLQTSGEASYMYDKTISKNELHGCFILSDFGNCRLDKIDTSVAESMPGVVKIIFAEHIPGKNSFVASSFNRLPEYLFAYDFIDYAGQAIGLVIAETYQQAKDAANQVKITYKQRNKPILTITDAINQGSFFPKPIPDITVGDADNAINTSPNKLENNEIACDTQYHFYMENQNATCEPIENSYNVHCATQWVTIVHDAVTEVLNVPNKSFVNVRVEQLGGAYGGKLTRANITACAAAVAAYNVNRTVRVALELNTSMELNGKRYPWYAKYSVGFDNDGRINGLKMNIYADAGNSPNDSMMKEIPGHLDNFYNIKNWNVTSFMVKTNLPGNTFTRSPGTLPATFFIEQVIEHVAAYLKKDSLDIRRINMYKLNDVTLQNETLFDFNGDLVIDTLINTSDYANRMNQVVQFNQNNRWKKKGISLSPVRWPMEWKGKTYDSMITIFARDGGVQITHGGIEIGQGIHVKAAQVVAHTLDIPIEIISVKHADSFTSPHSNATGGSWTSELVCKSLIECCNLINNKLDPIRALMPPNYTWKNLISEAYKNGVDLSTRHWAPPIETGAVYNIYGAAVSETTIDVLTGETQINRIDVLYDVGKSTNPEVDIGQAEGCIIHGLGYFFIEKTRYDPDSGKNLTNGTWEYKVPTTKDIPIDMRISFLKDSTSQKGVLGSKAIGEPPLLLSISMFNSVRNAIAAARDEIGKPEGFVILNAPLTVESVQQNCQNDYTQFNFNN